MPSPNEPGATADRIAYHYLQRVPSSLDDTWPMRSACRDKPGLLALTTAPGVFKALAACANCPVISDCGVWVMDELEYRGVAAGKVVTAQR